VVPEHTRTEQGLPRTRAHTPSPSLARASVSWQAFPRRMARTALFESLKRALRLAHAAETSGLETREFLEMSQHEYRLQRRDFLRASAGAAALAAIPASQAACGGSDGSSGGVKVAVVGAGLAGLNCAYRLKQSGVRA